MNILPLQEKALAVAVTSFKAASSIRATRFSSALSFACQAIQSSTQLRRELRAASRACKTL